MFGWLKKLNPWKPSALQLDGHLVADLDKMLTDPVPFKWNGRVHLIKPITTAEFLRVSEGMAKLDVLRSQAKVTEKQIIDAYGFLIESVCDTIKRKDIEKMTQSQLAAIYQLIMDTVTGKIHGTEKKTLKLVSSQTRGEELLEKARVNA